MEENVALPNANVETRRLETQQARAIFDPPNSLATISSKQLLFLGSSICMVSLIWLAVCLTFYPSIKEYHPGVNMFEARWLPSVTFLAGILCVLLKWFKFESIFLACAVSCVYSCASSVVTITVYVINLNKSVNADPHDMAAPNSPIRYRYRYIQLCSCMIVTVFFGFFTVLILLRYLYKIAVWYYCQVQIAQRYWLYLFVAGKVQICMLLFSVYVTSRIIALPFSYVHTYIIQELLCSLIMLLISAIQVFAAFKPNKMVLKLLLVLTSCQFFQEIFYAWNSYYISLYIHSNKIKLAVDVGYDQAMMTVNFVTHFVRLCLSAYTSYVVIDILDIPIVGAICKLDLNRRALQCIVATSASALLLASCHIVLDIVYATTAHVYRNYVAFTGISVFYAILMGVNLSFFLRHRNTIFLIQAGLFTLLLLIVSLHTIFIYLNTTFKMVIATNYEIMKRDFSQAAHMHFVEAIMAFVAVLICSLGGAVTFRLLHIDSGQDRRYGTTLQRPMMLLFGLGVALFLTTVIETCIISTVRGGTSIIDSPLDYGILDTISMYALSLLQIYATNPLNTAIGNPLIILFLFLLCEVLTTYHYLSTYTIYVQTMAILSDIIFSKNSFTSLVTQHHVRALIANYALQLIQWVLTIISLIVCAVVVEKAQIQRVDLEAPHLRNNNNLLTQQNGNSGEGPKNGRNVEETRAALRQKTQTRREPQISLINNGNKLCVEINNDSSVANNEDDNQNL